MDKDALEAWRTQNFGMLCSSIEQGMAQLQSGQRMLIPLPPGWTSTQIEPKLRAWCELLGYSLDGFYPDAGGSVGLTKD